MSHLPHHLGPPEAGEIAFQAQGVHGERHGGRGRLQFPGVGQKAMWQNCREQGWPRGDREDGAPLGRLGAAREKGGASVAMPGQLGICDGWKDRSGCRQGSGRITIFGKMIGLSS